MWDGISRKLYQSKQEHTTDQNQTKTYNMNKESKDHISIFNLISKSDINQ